MPYCTQCGKFVLDTDRFCPVCGTAQLPDVARGAPPALPVGAPQAQPAAPPPPPPGPAAPAGSAVAAGGIRPNTAAMLCYLPGLGWIAAVIFLTLDPYRGNRYIRFHAFQGLYLAVLWLLAQVFFFPFPFAKSHVLFFPFGLRGVIKLAVIVAQVVGIIRTVQNQDYRLPVIGELAERSLA